jgi:hypothetical protein
MLYDTCPINVLLAPNKGVVMRLRIAEVNAFQMLFKWANGAEVRKMAFSTETILWESHDS